MLDHRAAVPRPGARGPRGAPRPRARDPRRGRRAGRRPDARRGGRRGGRRLRRRRLGRRDRPRGRAHADLHVGHHGPAEGRAARAPQPAGGRPGRRGRSSSCRPTAAVVSWLPNAHIAERNAHHYLPIVFGLQVTTVPDARKVLEALPQVRPSWFFAVPRIWEKLKAGLETMLAVAARRAARAPWSARSPTPPRRSGSSSAARRSRTTSRPASPRPTSSTSRGCGRCSASTRSSPSTSARRRRRSRCSSSSTRSACRCPSSGA